MKKIVVGLSQQQFSEKAGISWHQVSKLVMRGVIAPVAERGTHFIFDPDDAPKAAAAIKQSAKEDQEKFRPEWEKLDGSGQAEFGSFSAFVAFQKHAGRVQTFTRPGRSTPTVLSARAKVGGGAR